jgi:hypothetical protein
MDALNYIGTEDIDLKVLTSSDSRKTSPEVRA